MSSVGAVRLGLRRGLIETRDYLRNWSEMSFNIVLVVGIGLVLFFQRNSVVEGTGQSLASIVLPGFLGMMAAWSGLAAAGMLSVEREDGTLLRAKAVPGGMIGYLVARLVMLYLIALATIAIILAAGLIFVPELLSTPPLRWLIALGVFTLGMLSTMPWAAMIGSLVKNPQATIGFIMLPIGGLAAISGIFYPITAMPDWVQTIAQFFPVYWLGHGMRAALQPDAVAAEIGESWRYVEMVSVLGAWAVAGLLLAPPILRRMARRESGSAVEERREAAMKRYG